MMILNLMLLFSPSHIYADKLETLTNDEIATLTNNAEEIINNCKHMQDNNKTLGTNCDIYIEYLLDNCAKFANGLDYCNKIGLMKEYVTDIQLIKKGIMTNGQLGLSSEEMSSEIVSSGDWFERHAGLLTAISVLIVIVFFFWQRHRDINIELTTRSNEKTREKTEFKARINRACDSIIMEMEDLKNSFDGTVEMLGEDPDYQFRNVYLNTDAYESILSSGLFTYLRKDTQDRLANMYIRIKLHNKFMRYREVFRDQFFLYDNSEKRQLSWADKVWRYDYILNQYEKDIVNLYDTVKSLISGEKNRSYDDI